MRVQLGDEADADTVERIRRYRIWFDLHGCLDELILSTELSPLEGQEDTARLDALKGKLKQIQIVYNE